MPDILSQIVAALESRGGALDYLQPPSMVDPTYGQYSGFASQYGSGAAGVDNFAQQVLQANPNATLGQFYSTYVLGTGNPSRLFSPSDLQSQYPSAFANLVNNSGYSISTPISQLMSGTAAQSTTGNPITDALNSAENWLGNIAGSAVFVVIGVVLVLGALFIFAANEGADLLNSPTGQKIAKGAALAGASIA